MSSSINIDDSWDEATNCRKYGAHISWHTRYIKKVTQLYELLEKTFDWAMNDDLNLNLQKAEGEVAVLHELADFMVQKKFPKAKEHTDEVVSLETEIMECWALVTANVHKRAVTGAARAAPPPNNRPNQDGVGNMKLIGELKPDNLTHDSSAGDLHVWRKKFESYYAASNLQLYRLSVQQAHLLNCLDRELSLQLDSSIQATTPVLGAGVTCLSIFTGIFEKKYPLLLRRKNFFSLTQQTGQDERSFAEAVKLAAYKADIAALTLQDSLCLVILTGCKDARLREKMSELEEPTIAAFNKLIDAHMLNNVKQLVEGCLTCRKYRPS